jgi:hypothetical protein
MTCPCHLAPPVQTYRPFRPSVCMLEEEEEEGSEMRRLALDLLRQVIMALGRGGRAGKKTLLSSSCLLLPPLVCVCVRVSEWGSK